MNEKRIIYLIIFVFGLVLIAGSGAWIRGIASYFVLIETETPTAIADHGQIYTKSDNLFYFQDGAGTENSVMSSDYAGIYVDENAVATTINVVDAFEHIVVYGNDMPEYISDGVHGSDSITIGSTGDYRVEFHIYAFADANNKIYEYFVFEITASGDVISGATEADPCVVTATGHSFSNGNLVKITGVVGMVELNDRVFTVANAGVNDFELNDDEGVGIDSTGFTTYTSGGTAVLATKLIQVHSERKYAVGNDLGACSGGGFASLTAGNAIELYIKCVSDATDITIPGSALTIQRMR